MNALTLLAALVVLCCVCTAQMAARDGGVVHDKVVVGVDRNWLSGGFNDLDRHPHSNKLFTFHVLNETTPKRDDYDLLVHAKWRLFRKLFENSKTIMRQFIWNDQDTIDKFEEKAKWKEFMARAGLASEVPAVLDFKDVDKLDYPVITKSSRGDHIGGGIGVYAIKDADELREAVRNFTRTGSSYIIEESLTGMGLAEMATFGSVYRGKLLSMRCSQREQAESNIKTSKMNTNYAQSTKDKPVPYIWEPHVGHAKDYMVPCGKDLVKVVRTMFAHTNYTGPYCTNYKLDRHMHPKMMEVNARLCGTLCSAYGDSLLVSTLVPLAFALLEANYHTRYHHRSALLHGKNHRAFRRILADEELALQTGGGVFNNEWIEVPKFDMNLRLTPLSEIDHGVL